MLGVFLDIETSGLDPYVHAPLEIACVVVDLLSCEELASYETLVHTSADMWQRRDERSIAINEIAFDEVQTASSYETISSDIEKLFSIYSINRERAFFVCQNPSFDRAFFSHIVPVYRQDCLLWPYHWLDLASMYWALSLHMQQKKMPFSLKVSKDAIAVALSLPCEQKPHRAMNGVQHLLLCYKKLFGFL